MYETPTSPVQVVLREPAAADGSSSLREPRWRPSGPIFLYRRGTEAFTTGGFVGAGTPTKVTLDAPLLRAEWTPFNIAGLESIVYVVPSTDGLARGTNRRTRRLRAAATSRTSRPSASAEIIRAWSRSGARRIRFV